MRDAGFPIRRFPPRRFPVRSAAVAGAVAVIALAGQVTASAAPNAPARPDGGPGHWSQVSNQTTNIAQAGLVRGADGVLHVLWEDGSVNGHQGIVDTPIGPGGAVGRATVIVSGQADVSYPDATATPGGLDVFWSGIKALPGPEGIHEATRPVRGGHWTVGPVIDENVLTGSLTATAGSDGKPWLAYSTTFALSLLHQGQRQDDVNTKCCVYDAKVGTDGVSGTSYAAYLSLITGAVGTWIRPLSRNGVTGRAVRVPGSVAKGSTLSLNEPIAITGRGHGRAGVFVSYGVGWPVHTAIDVYRVGARKPFTIARAGLGQNLANTDLVAGPNGRLWDAWIDGDGSPPELFVRASNPAATAWSPTARVALPTGTDNILNVFENAQAGKVDVVALMTVHNRIAMYATQVPFPVGPKKTDGPAPAAAQSWRIAKTVPATPRNGVFTALAATGKTTAWGFDSSGNSTGEPSAWTLRGGTWTRAPFPGRNDETVVNATATSPHDVWAFTESFTVHSATGILARVLHWNGHAWALVKTFPDIISEGAEAAPDDVWVFGEGPQNLAWYFNGHKWTAEGGDVDGGSVLGATNAWGFTGTFVEHWPGRKWVATNVASLLPKRTKLNNPQVTGVLALSSSNVYAFGQGFAPSGCGPTVILHFNGRAWKRVAQGNFGCGPNTQLATSDGAGGLWLPMPDISALPSFLVHYSNGKLTEAALPGGFREYQIQGVAHFPGTTRELAGGFRHPANNPNTGTAVILQYS